MRVVIGVFFADSPLTDNDALQRYRAHGGASDAGQAGTPGPRLAAFLTELTERYPRFESLSEDDRATSPWIEEFDICGEQVVIALAGSECPNAVEFILELADAHGLVCFDPKTRSILTAPPGIHVERQAETAIWPLTLATLSLALISVLWLH